MRIGPALLVCGALTLGSCGSSSDVRSTESFSNEAGEQLPPVDEIAATTTPANPPATLPGTRPASFGSLVLLASDLPGWDVLQPMEVPAEPTWEALDCPAMTTAWGATGNAGTRSRGSNGGAAFRNTAVHFETVEGARDVLDAVDRVWDDCTLFETTTGSFWSEPIEMPSSTLRTSGLAIGNASTGTWTLAYWQIDTTVVILEIEGDEMWTHLDPLLATLSARLDGTPTPIDGAPVTTIIATTVEIDVPAENLPIIVPATAPPPELPTTSTTTTTTAPNPQTNDFPPLDEDWTEHRLAHLAPAPDDIGTGWEYDYGNRIEAEPADPDDAIEGCDAPVPPTLDGYDLQYRNIESDGDVAILVGDATAAESQIWIDAFRALAACDLDPLDFTGAFDLVEGTIDGADDSVIIAGEVDFDADMNYVQVLSAARVDGLLVAAFVAVPSTGALTFDTTVADVTNVLELMLAAR